LWETKFHTHTKQKGKLHSVCICLYFWTANQKTKYFPWNDNKHSLTSICSVFLHERNFDLFRLLQNIRTALPFQTIYIHLYVLILPCRKKIMINCLYHFSHVCHTWLNCQNISWPLYNVCVCVCVCLTNGDQSLWVEN
jgi:hypothetical protein